mmetsp:Transcript_45253/g.127991  ORF Transcript_45253/g.127991 Transcript_45253/m.127991 type:complete len:211 (+) Transcript_45253:1800-2432(+)
MPEGLASSSSRASSFSRTLSFACAASASFIFGTRGTQCSSMDLASDVHILSRFSEMLYSICTDLGSESRTVFTSSRTLTTKAVPHCSISGTSSGTFATHMSACCRSDSTCFAPGTRSSGIVIACSALLTSRSLSLPICSCRALCFASTTASAPIVFTRSRFRAMWRIFSTMSTSPRTRSALSIRRSSSAATELPSASTRSSLAPALWSSE